MMKRNRLPPKSEETERIVLGSIMTERNALSELRDVLDEDCFYSEMHKSIFKAAMTISSRGDRVDIVSVFNQLKRDGKSVDSFTIAEIGGCYTFDVYQHSMYLHDLSKRRKYIEIALKLENESYDESVDIVDIHAETIDSLNNIFVSNDANVFSLDDAIAGLKEQINRNHADKKELTGTPTGFSLLDKKSGGLQKSDLIVIAGDTSQGKTSLSIVFGLNAAKTGVRVGMYSLEMKKEQLAARMASIESGVPANEILYSRLSSEQFKKLGSGFSELAGKGIFFDDRTTSNIDTIISSIRSMKVKYNIGGVIIDYLQILNVNMKGSNKEAQMGEIARRLKNLAMELDIWVIALSQLNRDRSRPEPDLSRLRDSGQIAEAADIVIFVYRPEVYGLNYSSPYHNSPTEGTALIDVGKGRNIGLLKFLCGFEKSTTRFYELENYDVKKTDNQPF
jgi:replicative DNA helicase